MNIREAKQQVEGAVRAYLAKDEHGVYLIPQQMQRPVILMGPPGVGKTAIVSQVADALGVNFVSYSITHHTRQSALGLPYIDTATYGGTTYRVSRYTMSEIIASVYDSIDASGVREGILFLDEINCASETLMPAMLQFLQYKKFGEHQLPQGWAVVCAGNPPEYNRSAREFDPAMLDRLKRVDVEPDVRVWMAYATAHDVHPAITSYLESKPESFYKVQAAADGTHLVTARGWEDLSRMLVAYERLGLAADGTLVAQYLQDPDVAEDFSLYLELFHKYQDNYNVADILDGRASDEMRASAVAAPFDERVALVGLLDAALLARVHETAEREQALRDLRELLTPLRDEPASLGVVLADARAHLQRTLRSTSTSETRKRVESEAVGLLGRIADTMAGSDATTTPEGAFEVVRSTFNQAVRDLAGQVDALSAAVDRALDFVSSVFGEGEEMLVFVSRLAVDPEFLAFEARHGSGSFERHSKGLMVRDRKHDLLDELDRLKADERAAEGGDDAVAGL